MQTAAELMTREVACLEPELPLTTAIATMTKRSISCLVIRQESKLVGILTERDLIRRVLATGRSPSEFRISDVMTTPVYTVPPNMSTLEALQLLRGRAFRRIPVVDGDGTLVGIVTQTDLLHGLIVDLEELSRLKSEFVATVSHEFRTPISLIVSYVELLTEEESLTANQQSLVRRIQRGTTQLVNLLSEALELTRLQGGRVAVTKTAIRLEGLFEELDRDLQSLVPEGVSVRWRSEVGGEPILSDYTKIKTILTTLLDNAFKFTETGTVETTATWGSDLLTLQVRDSGIGIPEAELPVIFEMFRQVDSSSTRRFGGVGLGLHIVKLLVDVLGGSVDVKSRPEGGSVFIVKVPAPRADAVADRYQASPLA